MGQEAAVIRGRDLAVAGHICGLHSRFIGNQVYLLDVSQQSAVIRRSDLAITSGECSRDKVLEVKNIDKTTILTILNKSTL